VRELKGARFLGRTFVPGICAYGTGKIRSSRGKLEKRPSRGCWTASVLYLLFWEDTCDRSRVQNKVGGARSLMRFREKMAAGMDFLVDHVNS
jgi:hypothetical protein